MKTTPLINTLADQIVHQLQAEKAAAGTRLIERKLADQFRVSRSPIRSALRLLHTRGMLEPAEGGGFTTTGHALTKPKNGTAAANGEDETYVRIAQDRLNGLLPERVTENELMRRYQLTRGQVAKLLRRVSGEGWIERLPGHGWTFLPVLTSMDTYRDSYRYRLVIEPAAILEPGFVLDRPALEECRAQQQKLIDGDIWTVSNPDLFDMNRRLHEAVMECSRNSFFIEGLRRADRLRRLMEYRQSLDRKYAIVRCHEHIQLVNLLLDERRLEASDFLRKHLSSVSLEKVIIRD